MLEVVEMMEELDVEDGVSVAARIATRVASRTRSVRTAMMATAAGKGGYSERSAIAIANNFDDMVWASGRVYGDVMQMKRARRSYKAPVEAQVGKVWSRGSVAWRTSSVVEAGRSERQSSASAPVE